MYYPYYIAYMAAGFVISIVVLFWALNQGQFKDQQRARFLPLVGERETKSVKLTTFARIQTVALFVLAGSGLAATAVAVLYMLIRSG